MCITTICLINYTLKIKVKTYSLRGGGGVDYFKVMTNNTSSFLTICFATFYNCKCEGWGGGGGGGGRSLFKPNLSTSIPNPPPQKKKYRFAIYYWQMN